MRKNVQQVFEAWQQGRRLDLRSISTDGQDIYSYGTCLVVRVPQVEGCDRAVLNVTQYSRTTSAQQSALRTLLCQAGYDVTLVDGQRRGVSPWSLLEARGNARFNTPQEAR
jgi:hypothetical protein